MKKKKIDDTLMLKKFDITKKNKVATEEYYSESAVNEIIGRISELVQEYIREYHQKPIMILISKQLEVLLKFHLNVIRCSQAIDIGHQIMEINFIMGMPTFTTPVLDGIEFEVR